jgi:PAS domain S-box-containing protein
MSGSSELEHGTALFERGLDGVLLTSPTGDILRANPAAVHLLGYSGPELRRLGCRGLVVDPTALLAVLEESVRAGASRGQATLRGPSGSAIVVELTAVALPGRGEGPRVAVTLRDLTASLRATEALRASEERFRQLAENAREVFWLMDVPGGRISYVNPAYQAMFGRTCQSLYEAPEDWYEALHPDDRERVVRAYEASQAAPYDEEYRVVHPDGSVRWVRDRAVPVHDAAGRVVRVAGITEDITARKHSEEALRRTYRALLTLSRCNEALVRATSEQALYEEVCRVIVEDGGYRLCWVGLVEHDERRTIRPVAKAGLDLDYLAGLDVVWADTERGRGPTGTAVRTGRPALGQYAQADPALAPWRTEALKRGFLASAAVPLVREGAAFGVLSLYSHEPDPFGAEEVEFLAQLAEDLSFGVAARRDRADRDRLTAQLVQADRLVAMGTLAAGVAHEINNPLAYVISALDHLDETLRDTPAGLTGQVAGEALEVLAEALEGARRVRLIVGDLSTFSRVEDARIERVELPPVIDSAVAIALHELRHRARVVKDYGPAPPVQANAAKLGQVFLNLLINAAQAIPAGRVDENEVRITTSTDAEGRARIEVRDTGEGIPPAVAGRIFEPFVTSKRPGEGTGLGLSICRNVIAAQGGEITFESVPGRGSVFRVTLPAAPAAMPEATIPAPPSPARDSLAPRRRGRVAVVDDEPGVRRAITRLLAAAHQAEPFDSARTLVARIAAGERFDAILCDLMMPDMTGMELHRELQRLAPQQAATMIFMTGGTFTPEASDFLRDVANRHVEKPFDTAALRALVQEQVDEA